MKRWLSPGFLVLVVIVAGGLLSLLQRDGPRQIRATMSVAEALGGLDVEGFARAVETRPFDFPADHGAHPDFRTEWWYLTGNLETEEGRPFGFQLTIFRSALAPDLPDRDSDWNTNQTYMGHFALTDVDAGDFHHFERFARGALGLAGAFAAPFRVWLEDWVMEGAGGEDMIPLRVEAGEGGVGISLDVRPGKPLILQGDAGLSQKGEGEGNASYYYSYTRLPATGEIQVGGEDLRVSGSVWMDREWSTSALEAGESGWDWFALQLSDGRDVMYGRIRREDGSEGFREGALVEPDGSYRILRVGEVELEELDRWDSALDGSTYPARWRLRVPAEGIDVEIEPLLADQELNLTFRYWEGAVRLAGMSGGREVGGRGYVELTGYGGGVSPR